MQLKAGSMPVTQAVLGIAPPARRGAQRALVPLNSFRQRQIVWLMTTITAILLLRAGSKVWSFEGTAVAGSTRETVGAESPEARAFYARRLEPRNSGVLPGVGQLDGEDFAKGSAVFSESKALLTGSSVDFYDDLPGYFAQLRRQLERAEAPDTRGRLVPEIGLSLNAGGLDPQRFDTRAGKNDRRFAELVAGLRSLHRPVFLRIGPGANTEENGYDPAKYVNAFRQVAEAVRAGGLKEVAIVWEWSPDA